jgi:hypothetical protein
MGKRKLRPLTSGGIAASPQQYKKGECVAIAATYTTAVTFTTAASQILYTVPSTYNRDLIITNGGPSTCFYSFGTGATGGSLVLTQCQVLASGIIGGISTGTSLTSIGFGSVVSVI